MKNLTIAALALALAACASQPSTTAAGEGKVSEEKEYRTGSRIPVRDSVSSSPSAVTSPSAMSPALPPKL